MVKTSKRAFLKAFKISGNAGFIVEFGDKYIRLFANHGQLADGAAAYELESPYSLADLWNEREECCGIQIVQNGDIMYIFHPKYIKKLCRYGNNDWRLENWELKNGPWNHMNTTETTMSASGTTGTITITASVSMFKPADVGRLIRLSIINDETKAWTAAENVNNGDIYTSDGKYYQAQSGGETGSVKPVHTEGTRSDGKVSWKYLHSGYGIGKIKAVNNETSVSVEVVEQFPRNLTTKAWELGMIYPGENYPMSGCFYKNRFWLLVDTAEGLQAIGSCSGDFDNFADKTNGEVLAENAVTVPVVGREYHQGRWIAPGDVLFVGTSSGEFYIDASNGEAIAADTVSIRQISSYGSKSIQPIILGGHVLFVDRFGTSIRDIVYSYERDAYDPIDASITGRHLLTSGIVDWAWQDIPNKLLWMVMGNGNAVSFTFDAQQQVAALAAHNFSGVCESAAVIPSNEQRRDDVWFVIKRIIGDTVKRYVEWVDEGTVNEYSDEVEAIADEDKKDAAEMDYVRDNAFFVDSGLIYNRPLGDTGTEISGLDHLAGCEVAISANGMECPRQVVSDDGKIKIKETDAKVVVGLPLKGMLKPQKIYMQSDAGAGLATVQRIDHLYMMLYRSRGGKAGSAKGNMIELPYQVSNELFGCDVKLFSGIVELPWSGGSSLIKNKGAEIIIENDSVYPMHILALVPSMTSSR